MICFVCRKEVSEKEAEYRCIADCFGCMDGVTMDDFQQTQQCEVIRQDAPMHKICKDVFIAYRSMALAARYGSEIDCTTCKLHPNNHGKCKHPASCGKGKLCIAYTLKSDDIYQP